MVAVACVTVNRVCRPRSRSPVGSLNFLTKEKTVKILSYPLAILALVGFITMPVVDGAARSESDRAEEDLSPATRRELGRVRSATARYHNISNALADGYVDIDVFIPNVGFHYLKPSFLDGAFEIERPELLVYSVNPPGNHMRLVAIEYAVPLDLSATPPEGFTGDQDVWTRNEEFGLWTLHVWAWLSNPDGIFAEHNHRAP
jgi:hypothetical protein